VKAVRSGNLLFTAGHPPFRADGTVEVVAEIAG